MSNLYGRLLRVMSWGESHGPAIGGVLEGFPAGISIDFEKIQGALARRRPGQSVFSTPRDEKDKVHFTSGIFEGKSTGMPIAFHIENTNTKSGDYDELKKVYRPSHADQTYQEKYGLRDHRGGGRSSARETANWVVAGTLAAHILPEIKVWAFVDQVGTVRSRAKVDQLDFSQIEKNELRCADPDVLEDMQAEILSAKEAGDSLGGCISVHVSGVPSGLGEPIFDKLHARLAAAMMGINAVKGFEYGKGFESASMRGSAHNDRYDADGKMTENNSGGIVGGISNGESIEFRIAFKPVASISKEQQARSAEGKGIKVNVQGRHDPCVVPRAVPIVEALTYFVLADFFLINKGRQI